MTTLMAGAIVLGAVSSWVLGFAPFFLALLAAILLGATTALVRGAAFGELLSPALTLLVTAQLAYGFGLLGQAGLARLGLPRPRASRRRTADPSSVLVSSAAAPDSPTSPRRGDAAGPRLERPAPVSPPR